ncbi:hypothetical protein JTE90_006842, partial [Oedothorax gibbosus]
ENYSEDCMTCLSNQGEISIFTVPDLRRQQAHNVLKREDINGISSTVFTKHGQAFYLHSPCELQRFSLSARDFLEAKSHVELPEGARPPPPEPPVEEKAEGDEVKKEDDKEEVKEEKAVDVVASKVESLAIEEKTEPEGKEDVNASQNESKGDLDITVDSVKDHIGNMCNVSLTAVSEKVESSSKVVQETVTKVSSVVVSTKETVINAKESVITTGDNAKEDVKEAIESARESFMNATENAKNVIQSSKISAKETIISTSEKIVNSTAAD